MLEALVSIWTNQVHVEDDQMLLQLLDQKNIHEKAVIVFECFSDPAWDPHDHEITTERWQNEMVRLIEVYQSTGQLNDARRAAVHHSKLMFARVLLLGYLQAVASKETHYAVEAFKWWMQGKDYWLRKSVNVLPSFSQRGLEFGN